MREDAERLVARAAAAGLALRAETVRFEEAGLDFRVAFAQDHEGSAWVLRIPRRPDVVANLAEEQAILAFVGGRLPVAVPRWEVVGSDLIAYRRLPGAPGLTLGADGQPVWRFEPGSAEFAEALGRLIAALHALDPVAAAAAGVPSLTMAGVRERWRAELALVREAFDVAPARVAAWEAWLAEDALWAGASVMTHGELYAAHVLVEAPGEIVGVLDWTTAGVSDPAVDFVTQAMLGEDVLGVTERAYLEAGGTPIPELGRRCAQILAAAPLTYARFALRSGEAAHREAAAAMLAAP